MMSVSVCLSVMEAHYS